MKTIKCVRCKKTVKNAHFNQVKCVSCRAYLAKYPDSTMTDKQIKEATKLIGKLNRHEIALKIGVSLSNLKRAFRGVRFPNLKEYSESEINSVVKYYEKHGRAKTEEKFPLVKVRSIVERSYDKFSPRCAKWSFDQKIELLKMSGLILFKDQAKFFNRPRANQGSIRSAYSKKVIPAKASVINGMVKNNAKHIVNEKCPSIKRCMLPRDKGDPMNYQYMCLWVDIEDNLKNELPDFIKQGISALAEFQRKLFKAKDNKDCKKKILKMINERSSL